MTHQSLLLPASVDDTSLGLEPCSGRHRSSRTALQHPSSETIWRPVKPCFSLFMLSQVTCPVSRLARDACGLPGAQRLHVRRAGDLLVVTEADDLHCPGKSLFAARLVDFATLSLFTRLSLVLGT